MLSSRVAGSRSAVNASVVVPSKNDGDVVTAAAERALQHRQQVIVAHPVLVRSVVWYPPAVRAGRRMFRQKPFDVILATGEPYAAFLIAKRIARLCRVPFVIDMRDPWTRLSYRNDRSSAIRRAIERRQE